MTCAEFQDLVGGLALGAVDAEERAALEAHLASTGPHEGCAEIYRKLAAAADELPNALPPVQPGDRVWSAIEERLQRPEPIAPPSRLSLRERTAWVLAAAAAILAVFFGAGLLDSNRIIEDANKTLVRTQNDLIQTQVALNQARAQQAEKDRLSAELVKCTQDSSRIGDVVALLQHPATRLLPFNANRQGFQAVALVNGEQKRAVVVSAPASVQPGKDLELWVIRGSAAPSRAGLMTVTPQGIAYGEVNRELLAQGLPDAFAVSLEISGGVDAPTDVVLVGSLKKKS